MKIIVDTNIIFSAILSSRGKIGELLLNKPSGLEYLSPQFLLEELVLHTQKIIELTGINQAEYEQVKAYVIQHIKFVEAKDVSMLNWEKAYYLLKGIDEKDISFLALAIEVDGFLWTGDKKLIKGLRDKQFNNMLTTDTLYLKYSGLQ